MNLKGEYAAFTGPKATEWAGHKSGKFATAQGNILAGPAVVNNMIEAFEKTPGHLSRRASSRRSKAGKRGGGDKRGQQSAALVIVKKNCGVWLHNDTDPAAAGRRQPRADQRAPTALSTSGTPASRARSRRA